jgi:cephalosporin hydroxylase
VGIEIGSLHGCSAVHSLERILTGNGSYLYCIDINDSPYLKDNLKPYNNVTFIQGKSDEILRSLSHHNQKKEFADYVYVDGSHLAVDVLIDMVLSWSLLKTGGIMMLDDYLWGIHTDDDTQKPKLGIDCFLNAFQKYYDVLYPESFPSWQVYLRKNDYVHSYDEAKANYEMDGGKV